MKSIINKILGSFGFELKRSVPEKAKKNPLDFGYVSAIDIVAGAKENNLSVCDFVEKQWDSVGDTQKVIDNMQSHGVFLQPIHTVCEIGAGTGRYTEKVLQKLNNPTYESYETAPDWEQYLTATYPIVSHRPDGKSLNQTTTGSIDVVHAHGVFVYLPVLVSCNYFMEILRVTKPGGYVVFDIISEDCLTDELLKKWLDKGLIYPQFLSTDFVDHFFTTKGFSKAGSFFNKYGAGVSKYLVYQKQPA